LPGTKPKVQRPSASDPPRPCEASVTSTARTTPPYVICSRRGGASSSVTARAGGWSVALHVDGATAYATFATDRRWCGYPMADLASPFRAHSQVAVSRSEIEIVRCLVLHTWDSWPSCRTARQLGCALLLERLELPRSGAPDSRATSTCSVLRYRLDYPDRMGRSQTSTRTTTGTRSSPTSSPEDPRQPKLPDLSTTRETGDRRRRARFARCLSFKSISFRSVRCWLRCTSFLPN